MDSAKINMFIKSIDPKIRKRGNDIYIDEQFLSYDLTADSISVLIENSSGSDFSRK